jgi:hypothetical protein
MDGKTFAPRAHLVEIATLKPGDEFMDEDGKRMIRVDTKRTTEAISAEGHEVWTYPKGAKGFVCSPIRLRGKRGMAMVRYGDRVRVLESPRRPGSCTDAGVGKVGTVGIGRLYDDEVRVDLDEPEGCRKSVRATAVELLNRLPWD